MQAPRAGISGERVNLPTFHWSAGRSSRIFQKKRRTCYHPANILGGENAFVFGRKYAFVFETKMNADVAERTN